MKCGKIYGDDAEEILGGCECGSNLFLYRDKFDEKEELEKERKEVVEGITEFIANLKRDVKARIRPKVEFDLESIRVLEEGVYEIDLGKLLKDIPLVVEIKEGKYRIHLASLFTKGKEKSISIKDLEDRDEE